jgi:hypothetical protein
MPLERQRQQMQDKSKSGSARSTWKGDLARPETKRSRAQRAYKLQACDDCGRPGTDRHHKDSDTGNNAPDNIAILCRRCHMASDGRLAKFISTSRSRLGPQSSKPCLNCAIPSKPLRTGRCHGCNEYFRRHRVERPCREDGLRINVSAKNAKATRDAKRAATLGGPNDD